MCEYMGVNVKICWVYEWENREKKIFEKSNMNNLC